MTLICTHCGKEFSRLASQVRSSKSRGDANVFCSRKCYFGYRASYFAKEAAKRKCPICGKPRKRQFCSQLCSAKAKHLETIQRVKDTGILASGPETSKTAKKVLIALRGHQCVR